METTIADLVNRFEGGRLTRRQLIQSLSVLMATGLIGRGRRANRRTSWHGDGSHIDPRQRYAALRPVLSTRVRYDPAERGQAESDPAPWHEAHHCLASTRRTRGHRRSLRNQRGQLQQGHRHATTRAHGLTPQQNVQFGFHIKDPDGVVVQICVRAARVLLGSRHRTQPGPGEEKGSSRQHYGRDPSRPSHVMS